MVKASDQEPPKHNQKPSTSMSKPTSSPSPSPLSLSPSYMISSRLMVVVSTVVVMVFSFASSSLVVSSTRATTAVSSRRVLTAGSSSFFVEAFSSSSPTTTSVSKPPRRRTFAFGPESSTQSIVGGSQKCTNAATNCYYKTIQRPQQQLLLSSSRLYSTTAADEASSPSVDIDELNAKITAKGDEIRQLKADGIDKEALAPHIEELLALKAQLPPSEEDEGDKKKEQKKKKQKGPNSQQAKQNNNNKNKKGKDDAEPLSESEIKLVRLAKVQAMKEANVEPFAYTYDVTASASQLNADYDGKLEPGEEDEDSDVSIAGRVLTRRVFGKLAFFTLQDETGIVQLQFDKTRLGDNFKGIKDWTDGGDIIGVRGTVRRTDKGELTIYAKEWTMLTKAVLPLPDKFHGLQDVTKRYRSRHVDLIVNSEVRETFRKRAKITSMLRRMLDDMGFLEIETPVLHSQSGGAEAKPFETYHNSMDMDLTLRIATELHLKRLIIGGFDRVYEVGRIFRNEGLSTRHNPEFTSVELYQAYADYDDMMDLTENLVCSKYHYS